MSEQPLRPVKTVRVIKLGQAGSLYVSIPSKFARNHGVVAQLSEYHFIDPGHNAVVTQPGDIILRPIGRLDVKHVPDSVAAIAEEDEIAAAEKLGTLPAVDVPDRLGYKYGDRLDWAKEAEKLTDEPPVGDFFVEKNDGAD